TQGTGAFNTACHGNAVLAFIVLPRRAVTTRKRPGVYRELARFGVVDIERQECVLDANLIGRIEIALGAWGRLGGGQQSGHDLACAVRKVELRPGALQYICVSKAALFTRDDRGCVKGGISLLKGFSSVGAVGSALPYAHPCRHREKAVEMEAPVVFALRL